MKPQLHRMIPKRDLGQYVGNLQRSAIEELIRKGQFPKPVRLSERRLAWIESELISWQSERIRQRDSE
jgi:prophage regulatory protein